MKKFQSVCGYRLFNELFKFFKKNLKLVVDRFVLDFFWEKAHQTTPEYVLNTRRNFNWNNFNLNKESECESKDKVFLFVGFN